MRKRILKNYIILVVIGVAVTGFYISQLTQNLYKKEVEDKLTRIANLIKIEITEDISKGKLIDFDLSARKYASALNISSDITNKSNKKMNLRITFIDFNGKVIGESETDYHTMENHLYRKEVQQAVKGGIGKDIRYSRTLKLDFFYIAVPVKDEKMIIRLSLPLNQIKSINQMIWFYTLVGIIAGLLLTVLLALKFSDSITKPINELVSISEEIAAGKYSKRVNVRSKDELGYLANTFNRMASQLEQTVADLVDKNVKVETIMNSMVNGILAVDSKLKIVLANEMAREMFHVDSKANIIGINMIEVIRNNQINNIIREAIEKNSPRVNEILVNPPEEKVFRVYTSPIKPIDGTSTNSGAIAIIQDITNIKKLEKIRTEFVSNVTHELKTPLTSIKGFIETLRAGAINDPDVAEKFLEIIDIESERLYTLINDILELSEIETRQKDSNIRPNNLNSIIEEVISFLQGVADKKKIVITNETKGDIIISVNRNRIKQMLINLIDNGIKYNYENGKVSINAYKEEGSTVISVKDTGIGISREHQSRIFERFYRVDKGRSRDIGGTGLGLSIVKHIVNLYNGDIKVYSEPGKGTEFIIRLPL